MNALTRAYRVKSSPVRSRPLPGYRVKKIVPYEGDPSRCYDDTTGHPAPCPGGGEDQPQQQGPAQQDVPEQRQPGAEAAPAQPQEQAPQTPEAKKAKKKIQPVKDALIAAAKAGRAVGGAYGSAGRAVAYGAYKVSEKVADKINKTRGKKEGDKGYVEAHDVWTKILTSPLAVISDWFGGSAADQAEDAARDEAERSTGVPMAYSIMKILFAAGGWMAVQLQKKANEYGLAPKPGEEEPKEAPPEQEKPKSNVGMMGAVTGDPDIEKDYAERNVAAGEDDAIDDFFGTPRRGPQKKSLLVSPFRARAGTKAFKLSQSGKRCYDDSSGKLVRTAMSNCTGQVSPQPSAPANVQSPAQTQQQEKPVAKKKPKKQAAEAQATATVAKPRKGTGRGGEARRQTLKDAYDYLKLLREYRDGAVSIDRMWQKASEADPDLTPEQFKEDLLGLHADRLVTLHTYDRQIDGSEVTPRRDDGYAYGWVSENKEADDWSGRHAPRTNPKFKHIDERIAPLAAAINGDEVAFGAYLDQLEESGEATEEDFRKRISEHAGRVGVAQAAADVTVTKAMKVMRTLPEDFVRSYRHFWAMQQPKQPVTVATFNKYGWEDATTFLAYLRSAEYRVEKSRRPLLDWNDPKQYELGKLIESLGYQAPWVAYTLPAGVEGLPSPYETDPANFPDQGMWDIATPRTGGVPLAYDRRNPTRLHTAVAPNKAAFDKLFVRLRQMDMLSHDDAVPSSNVAVRLRRYFPDMPMSEIWGAMKYALENGFVNYGDPVDASTATPVPGERLDSGVMWGNGMPVRIEFSGDSRVWHNHRIGGQS